MVAPDDVGRDGQEADGEMRLDKHAKADEQADGGVDAVVMGCSGASGQSCGDDDQDQAEIVALQRHGGAEAEVAENEQQPGGDRDRLAEGAQEFPCGQTEYGDGGYVYKLKGSVSPAEELADGHVEEEGARHAGFEDVSIGDGAPLDHEPGGVVKQRSVVLHAPAEAVDDLEDCSETKQDQDNGEEKIGGEAAADKDFVGRKHGNGPLAGVEFGRSKTLILSIAMRDAVTVNAGTWRGAIQLEVMVLLSRRLAARN